MNKAGQTERLASEVMGWNVQREGVVPYKYHLPLFRYPEVTFTAQPFAWQEWKPFDSWDDAWDIHKRAQARVYSIRQLYYLEIQSFVRARLNLDGLPQWPDVFGLLEPSDICEAALVTAARFPFDESTLPTM